MNQKDLYENVVGEMEKRLSDTQPQGHEGQKQPQAAAFRCPMSLHSHAKRPNERLPNMQASRAIGG